MNNPATALGQTIKAARQAKNLAAYQLAEQTGVIHRATIRRIETGEITRPRPETLQQLARALDLNLDDLLSLAGYAQLKDLPGFEPYLRAKHHDLPDEAIQQLVGHFDLIADKYRQPNN
ncbi:MAG: helix-turn-helix transcriptional regulator [bacterium]|nr:helix-turn-helix transcriptional regulator [bacterium]